MRKEVEFLSTRKTEELDEKDNKNDKQEKKEDDETHLDEKEITLNDVL